MNDELSEYVQSVDSRFELLLQTIGGMTAEELNWRPPVEGGNSVWVLAVHTAGNARAWIRGIACAEDITRDRPAEFASRGDDAAALTAHIEHERVSVLAALTGLPPHRLDARVVPPKQLWVRSSRRRSRCGGRSCR